MLNFLLVTVNIILTGVAGYLLLRRKSRFTPEWQKAVWYLLLILALSVSYTHLTLPTIYSV